MSTATPVPVSSIVLDASAVMRATLDGDRSALAWLSAAEAGELDAAWPDLVFVEVAHGSLRLVRAGKLTSRDALRVMARLLAAPVRVESVAPLALAAFHIAAERRLSAYDATYIVMAERLGATLVTADRRLAAATERTVLIDA